MVVVQRNGKGDVVGQSKDRSIPCKEHRYSDFFRRASGDSEAESPAVHTVRSCTFSRSGGHSPSGRVSPKQVLQGLTDREHRRVDRCCPGQRQRGITKGICPLSEHVWNKWCSAHSNTLATLHYLRPSSFGLIGALQASRRLQLVTTPNAQSAGGNCCHCDGFY